MVERNTLIALAILVIVSLVGGYFIGQFSVPIEQDTTTTITQTETTTTTSTKKIMAIATSTTTIVRDISLIPPPANSAEIIREHLLFDGNILLRLSIDEPTYVRGDIIHIKALMTNLTPNNISFLIGEALIRIVDENTTSLETVWVSPEGVFQPGLGPGPMDEVDLGPEETISLDWATRNWNMTGLHKIVRQVKYNTSLIPEGQYALIWRPTFYFTVNEQYQTERVDDTISFIVMGPKKVFPFHTVDPNEQIVGRMFENGRVLIALSINDSIFHLGETVNITATITNLTPQNITISLYEYHLPIFSDEGDEVWRTPISYWPNGAGLRPAFEDDFKMGPFETIVIPRASVDWNLTGLKSGGPEIRRTIYSGEFVPEGQYQIEWTFAIEYTKDDGGRYLSHYIEPMILKFTVET